MGDTYVKTSKLNMQVFRINYTSVKKKKKKIQGIKTNSIALASPYLSAHKCKIFNPPTHSEHFE